MKRVKLQKAWITLEQAHKKLQSGDWEIGPGNWDVKKSSRYVESVLMGIPSPTVYLSETASTYVIRHGCSQMAAMNAFLSGEYALDVVDEDLDGKTFMDLQILHQNLFTDHTVTTYTIPVSTPSETVSDIIARLAGD